LARLLAPIIMRQILCGGRHGGCHSKSSRAGRDSTVLPGTFRRERNESCAARPPGEPHGRGARQRNETDAVRPQGLRQGWCRSTPGPVRGFGTERLRRLNRGARPKSISWRSGRDSDLGGFSVIQAVTRSPCPEHVCRTSLPSPPRLHARRSRSCVVRPMHRPDALREARSVPERRLGRAAAVQAGTGLSDGLEVPREGADGPFRSGKSPSRCSTRECPGPGRPSRRRDRRR
jgi:hypothetical protein